MRDLARDAGRIVRATAQGRGPVLITDRGRALAMLIPGSAEAPPIPDPPEPPPDLSPEERRVGEVLGDRPVAVDEVVDATELAWGRACLALTRLEIKGLIRKTWAGYERATPR